jgi:hypothetical protein
VNEIDARPSATMFLLFVQKMRQTPTFLATIWYNHGAHENVGHYLAPGAAHDFRGSLYRPASDKWSADRTNGILKPAFEARWGAKTVLSVDQVSWAQKPASRRCSIPVRFADFRRGIFSPCADTNDQAVARALASQQMAAIARRIMISA